MCKLFKLISGGVSCYDLIYEHETTYKPEVRKAGGVYYTPQYIVEYIVENTIGEKLKRKSPEKVEALRVVDPACGSGSFLVGAYTYLLNWHLKYYTKDENRIKAAVRKRRIYPAGEKDYHLTIDEKQKILLNNIYGVDIDSQAVEVTKLSLLLKLLEDENIQAEEELFKHTDMKLLPNLASNIKCGNSLIGSDFFKDKDLSKFSDEEMRKVNVFDWEKEFPHVFEAGGFDCVVGNPPYVRQESISSLKQYLENCYRTFQGTADLYVYFIERGNLLLNKKGLFGFIVANKWIKANYGNKLRNFISKKTTLIEIIDFGELPVFEASTDPLILIYEKREKSTGKSFHYAKLKNKSELYDFSNIIKSKMIEIELKQIEGDEWLLANKSFLGIIERMRYKSTTLGDFTNSKIFRGILTGYNEAFIIDEQVRKKIIANDPLSDEIIKPFLSGKQIKRYWYENKKEYLIFTHHGINIDKYRGIKRYLSQFKNNLKPKPENWQGEKWSGRKAGTYQWYEIQDTIAYFEEFNKKKIVFNETSKELHAFLDDSNLFINKTGFIIVSDFAEYLLGLLNSKLFDFYYRNIFPSWGDPWVGGRVQFRGNLMSELPIKTIDFTNPAEKAQHDKMVSLVESMLETQKQNQAALSEPEKKHLQKKIDILDNQIDSLVYELYGLTEEEIRIVEEGV